MLLALLKDHSLQNHEEQDRVKPWEYFISLACSQPAWNCKFKSTPIDFCNFQQRKIKYKKLAITCKYWYFSKIKKEFIKFRGGLIDHSIFWEHPAKSHAFRQFSGERRSPRSCKIDKWQFWRVRSENKEVFLKKKKSERRPQC